MNTTYLPVDSIIVPEYVERAADRVEDDMMRKSIERGGIQDPLIVVAHEGRNLLVDGLTRLRIARVLKLSKVPAVLDTLPDGEELERYVRRIRFIVNHHRQDLLPTQEAELIEYFRREPFNMTNKEIGRHLGLAPDSISNALSVNAYIPQVRKAVDNGTLRRQAARAFDGMSEEGQRHLWKEHQKELLHAPGGILHAKLRRQYPPEKYPQYYRQPELIAKRLNQKTKKRRGIKRPSVSNTQEKLRMLSTVEYQQAELKELQLEAQRLDRRRDACVVPVRAILRSETLSEMVGPIREELEAWIEIYG